MAKEWPEIKNTMREEPSEKNEAFQYNAELDTFCVNVKGVGLLKPNIVVQQAVEVL